MLKYLEANTELYGDVQKPLTLDKKIYETIRKYTKTLGSGGGEGIYRVIWECPEHAL